MEMRGQDGLCPRITIDGRQDCISIGRDVIRVLGYPEYISILKNDLQNTIAITQSQSREVLSFKVPDGFPDGRRKMFRVYSHAFTSGLMDAYELDRSKSYSFVGQYIKDFDAVIFSLKSNDRDEKQLNELT